MKLRYMLPVGFLLALSGVLSCSKPPFTDSINANDSFHIKNGDYLIPVLVRGNTSSKKIIIFIQGGPVINSLDFANIDYPNWKNSLEQEYAVAYYDQRGTGNAQGNLSKGASILATWVNDLHQVAVFLKEAYHAEIIMLGHSFGGSLMYRYMIDKGNDAIPTKYISSNSPVTTDADADTLRWQFRRQFLWNTANLEISRDQNTDRWNEVLEWLRATPVIRKLPGINPYQLINQWNRYVEELINVKYPERKLRFGDYIKTIFFSAYNPFPAYLNGRERDALVTRILKEEESDDLMVKLQAINDQPLLIMTGRYDDICVPEELTYVFNKISSPLKRMRIIDYAGHAPFIDQPSGFFKEIFNFIQ